MAPIRSLILRITEQCNLRCAYCYAATACGQGCPDTKMSVETALEAVRLCCPEGGSLSIQFTGGEPLLNLPVIEAVARFGRETGRQLRFSVQTNGTLLTPETCRFLKAIRCAVGVSLDGLGPADGLRCFPEGTPSFQAAVQGIRNLGQQGIRCNLTTVVTRQNAAALAKLPDLALWLGNVSGVGLDLFRPIGRGREADLSPSEEDLTAGLTGLIVRTAQVRKAGVPFRFRELERMKKRQGCAGCSGIYCYAQTDLSLCVDYRGDCWPCSSLVGAPGMLLGNIRDGLPRRTMDPPPLRASDHCKACPLYTLCIGGCPAGRMTQPEGFLPMTCTMTRILYDALKGDPTL